MIERGAETIVAIASPAGPGRRGVLRASGPSALELVMAVGRDMQGQGSLGRDVLGTGCTRGVFRGHFDDGVGTQPLILLWMPGPRSFTREDVAEFHLPGSPYLLQRALARLVELGARPAAPGEFTRRAFESGRIDLTRAEGVLALVSASSEAERRSATALLFGGLEQRISTLRADLDDLRALCEASLDFDETDTGHVPSELLERKAEAALEACREAATWEARRSPAGAERRVALVGEPNAGKSSLFNALVTGGAALVAGTAGTTRDVLVGDWKLATEGSGSELCVKLFDMAGLEQARDSIGAAAQELGEHFRAGADLWLRVVDASACSEAPSAQPGDPPTILVWNKLDLASAEAPGLGLGVSASTGEGLEALALAVGEALGLSDRESLQPSPARLERELSARHRAALAAAARALEEGLIASRSGLSLDLFAEHLRGATRELDSISGRTTPEDLLDRVFGAFCIGK